MSTGPRTPATAPSRDRWPRWVRSVSALRRLALASVVANVLIVVTGGAVRLTNSGLGCPTWPRCTESSLTPTSALAAHGIIEFTNRQLTFVLVLVAVATWLVAMVQRRERGLATLGALAIPAQAVLGGLTVLTHLNPWLVGLHFLLSMAVIAVTFELWWRVRGGSADRGRAAPTVTGLVRAVVGVTAITLAVGTVVTGSGPHAGDLTSGKVHRNGLQVSSMAQLHADSVMVLVGLTIGLVVLVIALGAQPPVRRAAAGLLGVELGQGAIGYAQYFLHVPPLLVALHMLGACLVWLAALGVLVRSRTLRIPSGEAGYVTAVTG